MNRLAGPAGLPQRREDRELLLEEVVVIVERVPEKREGLGERASAEDDLGAAARQGIEGREPLIHPNRVVGAENGDGCPEPDATSLGSDRSQNHLGRADGEVRPVVLAHTEEVDP